MSEKSHTLILAVAPFADAALAVGPLAARRAARPDEVVTFASVPGACEIVASLGLAETLVEAPVAPAARASGAEAAAGAAADLFRSGAFLARMRRGRYDAVVDLFPKFGSMV